MAELEGSNRAQLLIEKPAWFITVKLLAVPSSSAHAGVQPFGKGKKPPKICLSQCLQA